LELGSNFQLVTLSKIESSHPCLFEAQFKAKSIKNQIDHSSRVKMLLPSALGFQTQQPVIGKMPPLGMKQLKYPTPFLQRKQY
jgi:hypothetical protein